MFLLSDMVYSQIWLKSSCGWSPICFTTKLRGKKAIKIIIIIFLIFFLKTHLSYYEKIKFKKKSAYALPQVAPYSWAVTLHQNHGEDLLWMVNHGSSSRPRASSLLPIHSQDKSWLRCHIFCITWLNIYGFKFMVLFLFLLHLS